MIAMKRSCPICEWNGNQFDPMTHVRLRHLDSRCPKCKSVERHRLVYLAMRDRIQPEMKTLHFAPESSLGPWLRGVINDYTCCDINPANVDIRVDITDIRLEDSTYDLVWCSHVLEHVLDDTKALAELYRITKPSGICVIQIPVWGGTTYEDSSIVAPVEREKHFYQSDHVKLYGHDVLDRMKAVGFNVEVITDQSFTQDEALLHSLSFSMTNEIYICTK